VQVECDTPLESPQGELKLFFRPHPNQKSEQRIMIVQSLGSPNWDSFGTPPWESRDKKPFGCGCYGEAHSIQIRATVSQMSPESPMACPNTKGAPKNELTNLLVGLMQVRVSE
jgi:hypothetical protein